MNVNPASLDASAVAKYTTGAKAHGTVDFLMNVIPQDIADSFAKGDILQILFFSILFGVGLASLKDHGKPVLEFIDGMSHVMFKCVGYVMKVAPIGAGGAMAFTVGKYGVGTLLSLGKLIACFYATSALFVVVVLFFNLSRYNVGLRCLGHGFVDSFCAIARSLSENSRVLSSFSHVGKVDNTVSTTSHALMGYKLGASQESRLWHR